MLLVTLLRVPEEGNIYWQGKLLFLYEQLHKCSLVINISRLKSMHYKFQTRLFIKIK